VAKLLRLVPKKQTSTPNQRLPTSFDPEDVKGCFGTSCDRTPEFRLITLEGAGTYDTVEGGTEYAEAGVAVALLCREHAFEEVRNALAVCEGTIRSDLPTLGFMLLPLHIDPQLASELQAEVTPEVWTEPKTGTPS
jgi:hypothetical protein